MKIATRHYLIPESTDEVSLMQESKNMKRIAISFDNKAFQVYTEEEDDSDLLQPILKSVKYKKYFDLLLLDGMDEELIKRYLIDKSKPNVVIDV
jgi:hypothetical protein